MVTLVIPKLKNNMKNLIKTLAFAFIVMLGINISSAQGLTQDTSRPEVIAKKKASQLSETLDLTDDQKRSVYRALVSNEVGYKKQVIGKDANSAAVKSEKKKIDAALKASMKKTLTPEQYKKWLSL